MQKTDNPFDIISEELKEIRAILNDISAQNKNVQRTEVDQFKYIPIQDIFNSKICSKPTFYKYFREGKFKLFKLGNKSFVNRFEFENSFHSVKLD